MSIKNVCFSLNSNINRSDQHISKEKLYPMSEVNRGWGTSKICSDQNKKRNTVEIRLKDILNIPTKLTEVITERISTIFRIIFPISICLFLIVSPILLPIHFLCMLFSSKYRDEIRLNCGKECVFFDKKAQGSRNIVLNGKPKILEEQKIRIRV